MSIRYTIRHNIPHEKIEAEDVNDSSTWDLNLIRKHELAETDEHDIVYRQHDGAIVSWAKAATQHAQEISDQVNERFDEITTEAALLELKLQEVEEEAASLTQEAHETVEQAEAAVVEANNAVETSGQNAESAQEKSNLSRQWATKTDGKVVENGQEIDYSSKYYAQQAELSNQSASEYSASAQTSAGTASTKAEEASNFASNAQERANDSQEYSGLSKDWATKTDGMVGSEDYSSKYYAQQASNKAEQAQQILEDIEERKDYYGIPIGHEYFSINPNIPQGSLPLLGGEYDRSTYSDLWSWVQEQTGYLKTEAEWQALSTANNGNVPYYSDGDGSTTFRVPSLKCWVRGANGTVSEVGSYLQAGLPNITGGPTIGISVVKNDKNAPYTSSGALASGNSYNSTVAQDASSNRGFQALRFDASLSNSIYGKSTTVQPESIVGLWLVKAYGTIVDTGSINEQQYIDDRYAAMKTYVDGKFESVNASGTNYIRYESGLQIYFGSINPNTDGTAVTYTFPVPFVATPISLCDIDRPSLSPNNYTIQHTISTTRINVYGVGTGSSWANAAVHYIIIGYWK